MIFVLWAAYGFIQAFLFKMIISDELEIGARTLAGILFMVLLMVIPAVGNFVSDLLWDLRLR